MNTCKKIKKNMCLYIDNMLSQSEKQQFDEHLKSCQSCKGELEELKSMISLTSNLNVEVPDNFTKNVMEKITQEAVHKERFSILKLSKYATVFAAVVLFAVVLKTPVMDYFEKSYIQKEESTQIVNKTDKQENDINITYENDIENAEKLMPKKEEKSVQNNKTATAVPSNENLAQAATNEVVSEANTEDTTVGFKGRAVDIQSDATYDSQDIENSSQNGIKVASLLPEQPETAKLNIETTLSLDEAKEIISQILGFDISVENETIDIMLSYDSYLSIYEKLIDNPDFTGFNGEISSDLINLVISSK